MKSFTCLLKEKRKKKRKKNKKTFLFIYAEFSQLENIFQTALHIVQISIVRCMYTFKHFFGSIPLRENKKLSDKGCSGNTHIIKIIILCYNKNNCLSNNALGKNILTLTELEQREEKKILSICNGYIYIV